MLPLRQGGGTPLAFDEYRKAKSVTLCTPLSECQMSLENIISVGLVGWLLVGMVLMGLGIW